jgi:hypothetical protein
VKDFLVQMPGVAPVRVRANSFSVDAGQLTIVGGGGGSFAPGAWIFIIDADSIVGGVADSR